MSTSPLPKRLIEVDLPIKRISEHARREKSIRRGHISTLHIWWARRPLAACRAVICAALWPDPADPNCPQSFRNEAAQAINDFAAKASTSKELAEHCSRDTWVKWQTLSKNGGIDASRPDHWNLLRFALLDLIADFANWDSSTIPEYLGVSRTLTKAAHKALGGEPDTRPLVVDPFAGGGAIPIEALRIGADTFASDLNPIPVLLNQVILNYIPRYGRQLADELKQWGEWIRQRAEQELADYYPHDPDGAIPIAYLWARTIKCEGPACGTELPLIRSLWLARKPHRSVALSMEPDRAAKHIQFRIIVKKQHGWVDQTDATWTNPKPDFQGTVKGGAATCPCCGYTTPVSRVRDQLRERAGGAQDARLLCIVTTLDGQIGRSYRLPGPQDYAALKKATLKVDELRAADEHGRVPTEALPPKGTLGFRIQNYGVRHWCDIYTPRQLLTLLTMSRLVQEAGKCLASNSNQPESIVIQALLALSLSRLIGRVNALCWWRSQADQEKIEVAFSGQTVPMKWDFAEACPLTIGTAGWDDAYKPPVEVIENIACSGVHQGVVASSDASKHPLPDASAQAFVTDPPYYDAVPYASLSDFFYVWLKRTVPEELRQAFASSLSPKESECIVDEVSGKDRAYFEGKMKAAMSEGRRILAADGIGVVVFAHKTTAGWETQLQAMIDAGWTITGSWPIDTEMVTRLRARESAALASSVHIVCRPRSPSIGSGIAKNEVGDWRDVLQKLPLRIHEWMPRLAAEGVVGADAIFACLGPALEIFSRYDRVEKASGDTVTLREYLEHVWAAVAKEALAVVFKGADASGFEEDARLTAMWLWTLSSGANAIGQSEGEDDADDNQDGLASSPNGYLLEYDAARKIAQGLGVHLESLASLVEIKGDVARLLAVSERTRKLFGNKETADENASRKKKGPQLKLGFDEELAQAEESGTWDAKGGPEMGATVLDRVHQSMILFGGNRGEALRRFLVDEGVGKDDRFWRLAQVLSYLYPKSSDEKRWIDGVLGRKKGLGL